MYAMKRAAIGAVLALGLVVGGAGAASAGEYNGKGGAVPGGEKGKSACSYSGRDVPDDVEGNPPGYDDDAVAYDYHGVQSYGQFVSLGLKDALGDERPGVACRGNAGH